MAHINERLDDMRNKILEPSFIGGKGLGNEINFYIFDYNPQDELSVRNYIDWFVGNVNKSSSNNRDIIEFDLYEMFLELSKEKNIYDGIFEMEKAGDKSYLYKALKTFATSEIFLEKMKRNIGENNVVFITGVGKIYPFVRTHNILSNLQGLFDDNIPVVLFFPGEYNEQDLRLFNILKADNYYRAFRLID